MGVHRVVGTRSSGLLSPSLLTAIFQRCAYLHETAELRSARNVASMVCLHLSDKASERFTGLAPGALERPGNLSVATLEVISVPVADSAFPLVHAPAPQSAAESPNSPRTPNVQGESSGDNDDSGGSGDY